MQPLLGLCGPLCGALLPLWAFAGLCEPLGVCGHAYVKCSFRSRSQNAQAVFRNTGSGLQNGFGKIAMCRKIHDVQIYDRIYGSKATNSHPPNSFSVYSLFYTHTVHGYAQVHGSINPLYILIIMTGDSSKHQNTIHSHNGEPQMVQT